MIDRFLSLTSGTAMVVSDLHGDRDAFDRCIAHFEAHHARGTAQRLVLLGDLIHGNGPPEDDGSLGMILDVLRLRDTFGPENVIMLLGNHEMPHIYGVSLARGSIEFTPRFEHALGTHRETIFEFFQTLPFYVRTAAGVMLSHAGPALDSLRHVETLRHFDHRAVLSEAEDAIAGLDDLSDLYAQYPAIYGMSYQEMAREYLAVDGPADPRYPHLLRALLVTRRSHEFDVLWDALFTQNERGLVPDMYEMGTRSFLTTFSVGAPSEQRVMVSGHIATSGGHKIVNPYHLRLSSAAHANPRHTGQYLLLDCAQPVHSADELVGGLRKLFVLP